MSVRIRRPPSTVALAVWLVLGLSATFVLEFVFPQLMLLAIMVGVLVVAGVGYWAVYRHWGAWFGVAAVALAGIGTMMLAEDLALATSGERVEAVVVDHTVDVQRSSRGTSYTHHYALERTDDGQALEDMVYRGEDGFDDVEEGTTIAVLADPDGQAPTKPADTVDIGADIAVLIVGLLASAGVFGACAASAARRTVVRQPR